MKRGISFLLFLMIFLALPVFASADMGPKPSVRITIPALPQGEAYATLLSKSASTGPHSAWNGEDFPVLDESSPYDLPYAVWEALTFYEDADGYYFLQMTERHVTKAGEYSWGYYPPENFKLLLYVPSTGEFFVSAPMERYAFHSYFAATVGEGGALLLSESYDYETEIFGLLARIGMTLLIELFLAFLFFARERRLLFSIAIFNVLTQLLLNLWLSSVSYLNGSLAFVLQYIGCEALVILIEGALLFFLAPRFSGQKGVRWRALLYAVVANAASLLFGLWVSDFLPGVF